MCTANGLELAARSKAAAESAATETNTATARILNGNACTIHQGNCNWWRGAERAHKVPGMAKEARSSTINACSVANTAARLLLLLFLWVFSRSLRYLSSRLASIRVSCGATVMTADAVHRRVLGLRPISLAAIKLPFLCTARTSPRTTMSGRARARARAHISSALIIVLSLLRCAFRGSLDFVGGRSAARRA